VDANPTLLWRQMHSFWWAFCCTSFSAHLTKAAFINLGAAMSNAGLRFFAVEHTVLMILAVVFANLGHVLSGRASETTVKHRRAATWYSLAVVVMLIAMPWGRPLFPHLS